MTGSRISESRWTILTLLRRRGVLSIDELVEASGLSKTATRSHLVRMERDGEVERRAADTTGPGRPPAVFGLTELGASAFPSHDDDVLFRLLGFLEDRAENELITEFFTELWNARTRALLDDMGIEAPMEASLDDRISALDAMLTQQSFMPEIRRTPCEDGSETITVRECNCPLPAAARASRVPCRLEVEFLAKVLGARPRSVSIARTRDGACDFEFEVTVAPSE